MEELRRLLRLYVNKELFAGENLPDLNNRRYYPSKDVVRAHMGRCRNMLKHSNVDPRCLEKKIREWQKADPTISICFRQSGSDMSDEAHFLFVYQAEWQKSLLSRYGKEIIFLDTVHKSLDYNFPLSFLVVKTNVDYQIVAVLVTQNEKKLPEGLAIIKEWNPHLSPKYGMVGYDNDEIEALEQAFPGELSNIIYNNNDNFISHNKPGYSTLLFS